MRDLAEVRLVVLRGSGEDPAREATRSAIERGSVLTARHLDQRADETLEAALARARSAYPGYDVAVVAAGVQPPFAWDARLAKAAHAAPDIAAAVPLCDASALHALLDPEDLAAGHPLDVLDRTAYCMGQRGFYETPELPPACAYLRGDALAELAVAGEGGAERPFADIAGAWRARGRSVVVCDYLYVGGGTSAAARAPDSVDFSAFAMHSPLAALRRAVKDAIAHGLPPVSAPALDARPVQLHVMHFWGGGLDKWVREFARSDRERTNLILATYRIGEAGGQRVVLYSDPDARVPIRTWDIARPILATATASIEYRAILDQIVREFAVESILVSSLIGHSLDALRQPVRTVVVAHDFYPICQAINPRLDERCGGCAPERLGRCAETNPHFDTLGRPTPAQWQALRDQYAAILVERRIEVVAPTPSVAQTLRRLDPRMERVPVRVIPHGSDFEAAPLDVPALQAGERLRVVVPGSMNVVKGALLLEAAAGALREIAEVTLVGCGAEGVKLARKLGWDAIERYELAELRPVMARLRPHAALLATVVPETFSYTLGEMWALGIPPVATALGGFRDRIRDGVDGILFEPTAQALVSTLAALRRDPARLRSIAAQGRAAAGSRKARDMVLDYHALLPLEERPVARFQVGVGRETALTEPYRQLRAAYEHLRAAYDQVSGAYSGTQEAYEHADGEFRRVNAELQALRATLERYSAELAALRVGTRWWRAREADRILAELRTKISSE